MLSMGRALLFFFLVRVEVSGERGTGGGEVGAGVSPDGGPSDAGLPYDDPWSDPKLLEADATLKKFAENLKAATDGMGKLHEDVTLGLRAYEEALKTLRGNQSHLQTQMATMLKEEGAALQARNAARTAPFAEIDKLIREHDHHLQQQDANQPQQHLQQQEERQSQQQVQAQQQAQLQTQQPQVQAQQQAQLQAQQQAQQQRQLAQPQAQQQPQAQAQQQAQQQPGLQASRGVSRQAEELAQQKALQAQLEAIQ